MADLGGGYVLDDPDSGGDFVAFNWDFTGGFVFPTTEGAPTSNRKVWVDGAWVTA